MKRGHHHSLRRSLLCVAIVPAVAASCSKHKQHYEWHPKLLEAKGRLLELINGLPLGELKGAEEYPKPRGDKTVTLSNMDDLSAFITRQYDGTFRGDDDDLVAEATACYRSDSDPYECFVYAALLKLSLEPKLDKKPDYYKSVATFKMGVNMSVTFETRPLTGLLPESDDQSLYYMHGNADISSAATGSFPSERNYIVLAARKKNLYLEIAVPAQPDQGLEKAVAKLVDYDTFVSEKALEPFDASTIQVDWTHPALQRIRKAHDATQLGLARFE